jgi:hypothetical protein
VAEGTTTPLADQADYLRDADREAGSDLAGRSLETFTSDAPVVAVKARGAVGPELAVRSVAG